MTRFTDNLWRDLAQEHGPALERAADPGPRRARRPRVLAGSTLALAGAGAAIALVLTSASGTPAFAVTENGDGSVLVTLSQTQALPQANHKLADMGLHEGIVIHMDSGPAVVSGPVTCTPEPGTTGQPTVKVLVGTNGTQVINSSNTGAGTWHLGSCNLASDTGGTGTGAGNTGNGGAG
jgi:hypothetical protein